MQTLGFFSSGISLFIIFKGEKVPINHEIVNLLFYVIIKDAMHNESLVVEYPQFVWGKANIDGSSSLKKSKM